MKFLFHRGIGPLSTNRKILRAALVVGSLTMLARVGSTIKELIVARTFGRSDNLDAFLIAFLVPWFVLGPVTNALGSALIPTFVGTRERKGAGAAQELFSSVLLLSLVALVVIAVLLGALAPYYVRYLGSGFTPEKQKLTRELIYVLLPFLFFSGAATCAASLLSVYEKFAAPVMVQLATPVVTMLFIVLGPKNWGAFSLAGGVVVGSFLEATMLMRVLKAQGIRFIFKWNGLNSDLRTILAQYAPMLGAAFLTGGSSVVDQSMAAMLPAGSVAALNYANKIIGVVIGVGATALSTAAFPYFSKMIAQDDWAGCRHTLKRYSLLIVWTTVPFTICLMLFSKLLIRILFERGAFTSADTELVSRVQICYAIQIPFCVGGMLFVRFLSSVKRNQVLLYGAVINIVLDIVLNLILMRVWGVAGIALSTSIVGLVAFLYVLACSQRALAREGSSALNRAGAEGAAH